MLIITFSISKQLERKIRKFAKSKLLEPSQNKFIFRSWHLGRLCMYYMCVFTQYDEFRCDDKKMLNCQVYGSFILMIFHSMALHEFSWSLNEGKPKTIHPSHQSIHSLQSNERAYGSISFRLFWIN